MFLAENKIIPEKHWKHKSELTNNFGETVAMKFASAKFIEIPKEWQHKATMKTKDGNTVAMIFA